MRLFDWSVYKLLCRRCLLQLFACVFAAWQFPAAAGSVLVWPLDPVVESGASGAIMWVENRGKEATTMQLRVVGWTQVGGQNRHESQTAIMGSPAIFRIEPGKRQLVRLTRIQPAHSGAEQAYRVLLDEIPGVAEGAIAANARPNPATKGLRFQVRYSIPLFSYGAGLMPPKGAASQSASLLRWRLGGNADRRWIEIDNPTSTHFKLVDITTRGRNGQSSGVVDGHLGYILAGSHGRWELPKAAPIPVSVSAFINGASSQLTLASP